MENKIRAFAFASLTMIYLLCTLSLQVITCRLLQAIAEKPQAVTIAEGEGVVDKAEQRADNNVTIMFNYE